MKITVAVLAAFVLLFMSLVCNAQDRDPAQVMLFGVFHFSNPGLDVVKTDQINVMTDENQAYLEELTARISEFNPTRVLLEFEPSREDRVQDEFGQYLGGSFQLSSNENHQLGFRIAAKSDAETVHGYDHRGVHWAAEPLFEYLQDNDAETQARMNALIAEITEEMQEAHATLTLKELLLQSNDPKRDRENRGSYLLTNHVGTDDNFVGADAAASWWHRNFRMYAIVQRHAQPGERVLVIGGQGHIAILRQLLEDDADRQAVDVTPYL
jgi:hypothetical protein